MARIRTIKPETFDDPDLCELPMEARWLFVGLWCQADKAGRLEDDPRRLQARILPFDRDLDCDNILSRLSPKFITRYVVDGRRYIQVNNFPEHQHPHPRETDSLLPPPPAVEAVKSRDEPCNSTAEPGKAGTSRAESGSGNGSLDSGSGCGKVAAVPAAPAPVKPVTKPLGYKPRIDVTWPGRPPVPSALHAEFIDKLGGDREAAHRSLIAWYPEAAAAWEGKPIGDDDWAFWRHRLREKLGTTRSPPTKTAGNRAALEQAIAVVRQGHAS
jgi:hypothetical protein